MIKDVEIHDECSIMNHPYTANVNNGHLLSFCIIIGSTPSINSSGLCQPPFQGQIINTGLLVPSSTLSTPFPIFSSSAASSTAPLSPFVPGSTPPITRLPYVHAAGSSFLTSIVTFLPWPPFEFRNPTYTFTAFHMLLHPMVSE